VKGIILSAVFLLITATAVQAANSFVEPAGRMPSPRQTHCFWDRKNKALFAGVLGVRVLDYYSTERFLSATPSSRIVSVTPAVATVEYRYPTHEAILPESLVRNKPAFAAYSIVSAAGAVGISYWLHRRGHHRWERVASVAQIAFIGTLGARNLGYRNGVSAVKTFPQGGAQ
jgi:hypothetical protein